MADDIEWTKGLNDPIDIVDEDGNYVETINETIPAELLPQRQQPPATLYELLHAEDVHTLEENQRIEESDLAVPGTYKNE